MDSQMAGRIWTVWLLDFAERIGGKLATFIAMLATLKFSVVQLPVSYITVIM